MRCLTKNNKKKLSFVNNNVRIDADVSKIFTIVYKKAPYLMFIMKNRTKDSPMEILMLL